MRDARLLLTCGLPGSGKTTLARRLATERGAVRLSKDEWMAAAKKHQAPFELVVYVAEHGRLPVPNFAAGGIATPADAALCRMLGAEAVFVGSGIFKSGDPESRARAIVEATTHWDDPAKVAAASEKLGEGMKGLEAAKLVEADRLQTRGW